MLIRLTPKIGAGSIGFMGNKDQANPTVESGAKVVKADQVLAALERDGVRVWRPKNGGKARVYDTNPRRRGYVELTDGYYDSRGTYPGVDAHGDCSGAHAASVRSVVDRLRKEGV